MAESSPLNGLSALRLSTSSPVNVPTPQESADFLGAQDALVDPAAKWEAFAGAALKPASGGFGEAMGNALGALAEGRNREAELRAKYIPLIANTLLQRQLQMMQMQAQQWKLNQDFNTANVTALTSLLQKREPITPSDVVHTLGSVVARGLSPPEVSQRFLDHLQPVINSPKPQDLRNAIMRLSISGLKEEGAYKAVTPEVKTVNTGGAEVPFNVAPNAGGAPLGVMSGEAVTPAQMGLGPKDLLGATFTEKDQAGNVVVGSRATGDLRYAGSGAPKLGAPSGSGTSASAPPATTEPSAAAPATTTPSNGPPGASPLAPGAVSAAPSAVGSSGVGARPPLKTVTGLHYEEDVGKKMSAYQEDLAGSVEAMRNLQQRLATMKQYVTQWTPGASAELRLKTAAWLKDTAAMLGLSPEQADSISSAVAKGKIENAQAFQKLAIQGTLDILKAANPRFTQAEFGVISQNNPNIALDPASLDKMMNFMTRQYQLKSAELQAFDDYRQRGGDLAGWQARWNQEAKRLGYIRPSETRSTAKGSAGAPAEYEVDVSRSGRPIRRKKGEKDWEYYDAR